GVDAGDLVGGDEDRPDAARGGAGDEVGEVDLSGGVVSPQGGELAPEELGVGAVDPGVALADRPGRRVGVALLDDGGDPAGVVADDPAVAVGVGRLEGGEGEAGAAARAPVDEGAQGGGAQ